MALDEGYLFAKTIKTRKEQRIDLPLPVDNTVPDVADLKII
jgi:hypothetical protein